MQDCHSCDPGSIPGAGASSSFHQVRSGTNATNRLTKENYSEQLSWTQWWSSSITNVLFAEVLNHSTGTATDSVVKPAVQGFL